MARTRALALLFVTTAGCWNPNRPGATPAATPSGTRQVWELPGRSTVALTAGPAQPIIAIVARDGDPRPAVALAVQVDAGSAASVALAAIVEKRLAKAGLGTVDSRVDRDGYRVRVLLDEATGWRAIAATIKASLLTPIAAGSEEVALAQRRLAALARHPLDDAALEPIAACTGRLGILATEPVPDPTTSAGLAALEAWRRAAHVAPKVSIGIVAPQLQAAKVGEAVSAASGTWPMAEQQKGPWPDADAVGLYVGPSRSPATARLDVALRVPVAERALEIAERISDPRGLLVTQLGALPSPFRVVEVSASARPRGGCVAMTLETARPIKNGSVPEAAAVAATLARRELESLSDPRQSGSLSSNPWRSVVRQADPREAAALAAFWAVGRPPYETGPERSAIALEVAPEAASASRAAGDVLATQIAVAREQLMDGLTRAAKAFDESVAERRVRYELGQGELWVLVASPCGTLVETSADAGATALATLAAVAGQRGASRDVVLEPWITPDGVGVMAHGARRPDDASPRAAAIRIADEAAHAFVGPAAAFPEARATLLAEIGDDAGSDGRALGVAAEALAPSHPSWLAPLGTWDAVARLGDEAVSLRWAAVAAGPVRVAVLANESAEEGDAAFHAVDRWMVRGLGDARACPAMDTPSPPNAGVFEATLSSRAKGAQALVAFPAPSPGAAERALAELLVAALDGPSGWLAHALSSLGPGVTGSARLAGGSRGAALVIDVRAPDAAIEPAIAQVRALVQRIAMGAATTDDLTRASAHHARVQLEASLDPRRRLVDLWLGRPPVSAAPPTPTLEAFRTFAATTLRAERTVLVVARPKR